MVFMVFCATAINYVDRANLGVAAPYIAKDLNLSPEATGALLGAFFWNYAAFQLPWAGSLTESERAPLTPSP